MIPLANSPLFAPKLRIQSATTAHKTIRTNTEKKTAKKKKLQAFQKQDLHNLIPASNRPNNNNPKKKERKICLLPTSTGVARAPMCSSQAPKFLTKNKIFHSIRTEIEAQGGSRRRTFKDEKKRKEKQRLLAGEAAPAGAGGRRGQDAAHTGAYGPISPAAPTTTTTTSASRRRLEEEREREGERESSVFFFSLLSSPAVFVFYWQTPSVMR